MRYRNMCALSLTAALAFGAGLAATVAPAAAAVETYVELDPAGGCQVEKSQKGVDPSWYPVASLETSPVDEPLMFEKMKGAIKGANALVIHGIPPALGSAIAADASAGQHDNVLCVRRFKTAGGGGPKVPTMVGRFSGVYFTNEDWKSPMPIESPIRKGPGEPGATPPPMKDDHVPVRSDVPAKFLLKETVHANFAAYELQGFTASAGPKLPIGDPIPGGWSKLNNLGDLLNY